MTDFSVRYLEPGGSAIVDVTMRARDAAGLRAALEAQGHVVIAISPRVQASEAASLDVAWWCRELGTLLRAGMTVVEAIETLASAHRGQHEVSARLLQALGQGQSLSSAMRTTGAFPEVLLASVTASERTSTLPRALDDYLRYDEMLGAMRRRLVSAAIYPSVVVGLGILITVFLLVFVIPRFSTMYTSAPKALSGATQAVLWVSGVMREHLPLMASLLGAFLVLLAWAFSTGRLSRMLLALVDAIEPLRIQWTHFRLAKLFQSLALMYRGGYTIDEALEVALGLSLGPRLGQGLIRAREEIAQGKSASTALESAGLLDSVGLRLVVVGERVGSFDTVLQTIADRHAQAFSTFVERATRLVEPILMLLVALVVGGIVVMMYMPIFDMANGLGGAR